MAYLGSVTVLYLDRTQVGDLGLSLLQKRPLETLSVNQTRATNRGVSELQRALPNCRIFGYVAPED
jgi:hypothetical protein